MSETAYEKSHSQKVMLLSLSKLDKCRLDGILEMIYRPGILAALFLLLLTGKVHGYIQQQSMTSTSFVVLPFAGTGIVNCAVLPCFFSNVQLKIGFLS